MSHTDLFISRHFTANSKFFQQHLRASNERNFQTEHILFGSDKTSRHTCENPKI